MSKKVAGYFRISKSNMGQDVDRQLHEVREFCKRMEYEIVEEYVDEGFARTTRKRPSLQQLIKDAHQRKFQLVIADELSRFAGTPTLLLNLLEELRVWNIHLVSVKEGISTDNAMGELLATMLSAISKMELFSLSHRIVSGISNKRRKNGTAAWGRRSNLTGENKEEILRRRKEGMGIKRLRKEYKVSPKTLHSLFDAEERVVA